MLHSEILPEHDYGGELIELPEDEPTYVHFAQCASLWDGIYFRARLRLGHCSVSGDADPTVSNGQRRQSEPNCQRDIWIDPADDLFGGPQGRPRTDKMIAAAVQWAERIMQKVDSVYSDEKPKSVAQKA